MLHFVILDDEINHNNFLKLNLDKIFHKYSQSAAVVLETTSWEDVIHYAKTNVGSNVYFLDINLNTHVNGIDVAHQIRELDQFSYVIYITAHTEYSLDGYKTKTFDFLTKPIKYDDLEKCCVNLFNDYKSNKTNGKKHYWLKSGSKIHQIDIEDIMYFCKYRNTVEVVTTKGILKGYDSLKNIMETVSALNYVMPNKSFLVNKAFIRSVDLTKNDMYIMNGAVVPITRHYKKDIKKLFQSTRNNM